MNMVFEYLALGIGLFLILYLYIRLAQKFQLEDTMNSRSSHTTPAILGGGLVIPLAVILYATFYNQFNSFFIGLFLVAIISFWDDIKNLPNQVRIILQLAAVILLVGEIIGFSGSIVIMLIVIVIILGTINAVNFMDGINGITAAFGTVTLVALTFINSKVGFVDQRLLIYILIAVLVFSFYNFRKQAKCFAGDVGSISLGFILVYFTLLFYMKTGDLSVIVLWSVYGVDSVITIINRLVNKENIFKAHRSHLYQYYANELGRSHLQVAAWYGIIQGIINVLFVLNLYYQNLSPLVFTFIILASSGVAYIFIRMSVLRKVKRLQLEVEG